jgi:signal transduction histidine kinase
MPRRLLHEPHLLAHELRTPLAILSGWYSLVRDGDISPDGTPAEWAAAMTACQEAVDRLNLIISQACDEAISLKRLEGSAQERFAELVERTTAAIGHSREVMVGLERLRRTRSVRRGRQAEAPTSRAASPP